MVFFNPARNFHCKSSALVFNNFQGVSDVCTASFKYLYILDVVAAISFQNDASKFGGFQLETIIVV